MTELDSSTGKIKTLIDLLKTSGFRIDARIVRQDADTPAITVELSGEDVPLFEQKDGELIKAVNQLAIAALDLSPEDEDLICFHVDSPRSAGFPARSMWQTAS